MMPGLKRFRDLFRKSVRTGTAVRTVIRTVTRHESSQGDINAFLHVVQLYPDAVRWYLNRKGIFGVKIPDVRSDRWDSDSLNTLMDEKEYILQFVRYLPQCQTECEVTRQKKPDRTEDKKIQSPLGLKETLSWPVTDDGIRYNYLFDYLSLKYNGLIPPELKARHLKQVYRVRRQVWRFKYDLDNPEPVRHAQAVEETARQIADLINATFNAFDREEILFVCLPASSQLAYLLRFREFSSLVCRWTEMSDGMDGIHIVGTKTPRHKGGKSDIQVVADEEMFYGKNILLFDDVLTTGATVRKYAAYFNRMKAHVIGAVFIARTLGPDDIDRWKSQILSSESPVPSSDGQTDRADGSSCGAVP